MLIVGSRKPATLRRTVVDEERWQRRVHNNRRDVSRSLFTRQVPTPAVPFAVNKRTFITVPGRSFDRSARASIVLDLVSPGRFFCVSVVAGGSRIHVGPRHGPRAAGSTYRGRLYLTLNPGLHFFRGFLSDRSVDRARPVPHRAIARR